MLSLIFYFTEKFGGLILEKYRSFCCCFQLCLKLKKSDPELLNVAAGSGLNHSGFTPLLKLRPTKKAAGMKNYLQNRRTNMIQPLVEQPGQYLRNKT